MKLLNRAIFLLLFAIVTMGWTAHDSLAAEKDSIPTMPPKVIPTDYSGDGLVNFPIDFAPFSTQHIRSGHSLLELLTESTLRVSGSTNAYIPVNTIKVVLYLQQWNPSQSKWVDVLTIGPATNYGSSSVSYSKQAQVIRGYSYRIRAQHETIHNGIIEKLTSISNQIYVN
ncbi:hypothetical protein [Sporosarcina beigongshangi]|uniref:hypothetical protein n=1 Tax=Sporosarcina beigongshangi TaxID=2782538 RepID=UPI00193A4E3C|nr:hypothetical protein [Sporosarcina beigongshangi]